MIHMLFPKSHTITKYFFLLAIIIWSAGDVFTQNRQKESYTFDLDAKNVSNLMEVNSYSPETEVNAGIRLSLPDPLGNYTEYFFFRNEIMSDEMVEKYPTIATYSGYSPSRKHHFVNLVLHEGEFHVFILGDDDKSIMIDKTTSGKYRSYFGERTENFFCSSDHDQKRHFMPSGLRTSTNGSTLRTYKLAIVITDEYEAGNGGNASASAVAVALATVSDMTAIYKRDLAVQFTATVRPETTTFNINPANAGASYGGTVIGAYFSTSDYDLGQVFHRSTACCGGSGQAMLAVVCSTSGTPPDKAKSWSTGNPNNDYGFMSIVAHEVAHMFNATHTFNSNHSTYCGPSLTEETSYEPGSGSTLMAYPGVCSDPEQVGQNLTDALGTVLNNSDPYFHTRSLEQMVAYISGPGNNCASATSTGNTPPTANATSCIAATIPANTPFQLTGNHTDGNNDAVTYCWEQFDAGPAHGGPELNCGAITGPIFRSYSPSTSPTRFFPGLTYILNNNNVPLSSVGECLPTVSRTLNFKLTVRDNNAGGGGIDVSSLQINVDASVGPLAVTSPNTNVTWTTGTAQIITWSGFNSSSICNSMNILLSVDGGLTFPLTLASGTPNDGSQSVTIPSNIPGGISARIKIESNCNACVKFFDISNVNFTISSPCQANSSNICQTNSLTLPFGDPGLNLGLTVVSNAITQKALSITNASPTSPLANATTSGGSSCQTPWGNEKYVAYDFSVSQSGNYTISNSTGGQIIFSVFLSTGFNPAAPCSSTFIGSNATGAISYSFGITLPLIACTSYKMVVWTLNGANASPVFNFSGAGSVYDTYTLPVGSYSYTFLAVNSATGIIAAENASSDFTSLSGGTYSIYGVSYYSGAGPNPPNVNPSSWIGSAFSSLEATNTCHVISGNSKSITVTCPTSVVLSIDNSGAGTLRDIYGCLAEGSTITFNTGVHPTLTAPLLLNKNIIIDGNVEGSNNPSTNINLSFTGTYGIKIDPLKTITLKDVKVVMVGAAAPVVQNEGNLTFNNADIIGNVTPVINNTSTATLQIYNKVNVKKQ
jgi:Metallo-peptidase family M12B Reprolysin-like